MYKSNIYKLKCTKLKDKDKPVGLWNFPFNYFLCSFYHMNTYFIQNVFFLFFRILLNMQHINEKTLKHFFTVNHVA